MAYFNRLCKFMLNYHINCNVLMPCYATTKKKNRCPRIEGKKMQNLYTTNHNFVHLGHTDSPFFHRKHAANSYNYYFHSISHHCRISHSLIRHSDRGNPHVLLMKIWVEFFFWEFRQFLNCSYHHISNRMECIAFCCRNCNLFRIVKIRFVNFSFVF